MKKDKTVKYLTKYAAYLLLVWGFYRYLFQFPDEIQVLIIKPIIWLLPLFVILAKEKKGLKSLGVTTKNLFPAIYYSLALGAFFVMEALIVNVLKYKGIYFSANIGSQALIASFSMSFVTAITEELAFRGFLFNRLWSVNKNEWLANLTTSVIWGLIHVPVSVFVWKLDVASVFTYLFLVIIFGIGSAFVFARTKNIFSSVFLHVLWQWPIILFR